MIEIEKFNILLKINIFLKIRRNLSWRGKYVTMSYPTFFILYIFFFLR